jgi:Flp pilus assembly protein TadG
VEFALVAPVLFLMFFGTLEIGREFMVSHAITLAACQGCRKAVVGPTSTAAVTTTVNNSLAAWGLHDQTTTVQVNGASADAGTAMSGDAVTVTVSIPMSSVTIVPGASRLGNMTRTYTLRRE